ncbi:MAG: 2-oxo-4-hydroxy-4-carboxy-5-ureidoimidazoline decarboxylase [Cyanobacteria bacterium P01_A01_bin.105]
MTEKLNIETVNQMSQAEFVAQFGAVFEETPAIAHHTWTHRPFSSRAALYRSMVATLKALSPDAQLALIQAHPDLGSRAKMAEASVQEQSGAGLHQLTAAEYERFQTLNAAYKDQFGFPFILAVKGHTLSTILAAFEARLQHDLAQEKAQALAEIAEIARFRLDDLVN